MAGHHRRRVVWILDSWSRNMLRGQEVCNQQHRADEAPPCASHAAAANLEKKKMAAALPAAAGWAAGRRPPRWRRCGHAGRRPPAAPPPVAPAPPVFGDHDYWVPEFQYGSSICPMRKHNKGHRSCSAASRAACSAAASACGGDPRSIFRFARCVRNCKVNVVTPAAAPSLPPRAHAATIADSGVQNTSKDTLI